MHEVSLRILELLATYSFLSISQFEYLDMGVSKKTLYSILKSQVTTGKPLIGKRTFRYNPKLGRVEDMYYLKPSGKKYLIRECGWTSEEIKMPLGPTTFYKDYVHRKRTIWTHILLKEHVKKYCMEMMFFDSYFEGNPKATGKGRESATKLLVHNGSIRADGICMISKNDIPVHLLCIEIHNGYDVKRICNQLEKYVQTLALGSPSLTYDITFGAIVATIFEHDTTLHTCIERLKDNPLFRHMKPYFLFKHYESLTVVPLQNWHTLYKKKKHLFN